ncbi:hypothetical protein BV22DRAFT_474954 [Leucogyrophana mollusca]|uniref:Uncharacterized protein n=1 Tax=Leucogyrophana mollusca TaxID=85980 RepID=A0ACB8BIB0_9AGAM|nr:hypothetical protein BV22DRAFT_474954 [Leucogyrophana mollusca]
MSLTASENIALETLPGPVLASAKRAIDGSIENLQLLSAGIGALLHHVHALLPIFYVHLRSSRIPNEVKLEVVRDIMLAKWSFMAITRVSVSIGHIKDSDVEARRIMQSKSSFLFPWLPFFYHHFLAPPSDHHGSLAGLSVTRLDAIGIIRQALLTLGDAPGAARRMVRSTPNAQNAVAQMWRTVIDMKYDTTFAVGVASKKEVMFQLQTLRIAVLAVVDDCTDTSTAGDPSLLTSFVDLVGGPVPMATTIISYIRQVAAEGAKIEQSQPVQTLKTQLGFVSACFETSTRLLRSWSKQDPTLRETLISAGSIQVVATAISLLWPRFLVDISGGQTTSLPPNCHDPYTLMGRRAALQGGYCYVSFAMEHADDNISAVCEALGARLLHSILQTGLLPNEDEGPDRPHKDNSLAILRELMQLCIFDRTLTAVAKAVENIASRGIEKRAEHDKELWRHWGLLKASVDMYTEVQTRMKEKFTFGSHCAGPDCHQYENTAHLHRCLGCAVARYCSKQCQRIDWRMRHQHVCKALRLAVGPSRSPDIARSLPLLAGIEVIIWTKESTRQLVINTRKARPNCNWLVVELDMNSQKIFPKYTLTRPS